MSECRLNVSGPVEQTLFALSHLGVTQHLTVLPQNSKFSYESIVSNVDLTEGLVEMRKLFHPLPSTSLVNVPKQVSYFPKQLPVEQ